MIGNPHFHLLPLLDIICERFPPTEDTNGDPYRQEFYNIKVTCPSHKVHSVSVLGFQLLELVETANGSSEQSVELVDLRDISRPLISALISRVTRQERRIRQVQTSGYVEIHGCRKKVPA